MGTSQSSKGPGAGVALVPPWADDLNFDEQPEETDAHQTELDLGPDAEQTPNPDQDGDAAASAPSVPLAQVGRFGAARTNLGAFARHGNTQNLRRTLGHYVRSGYGGSSTMSRRLAGTAVTAARLGAVLAPGAAADGSLLREAVLAHGANADAVLDAIAYAASPADGTQDREASQRSVRDAMSDLLATYPDVDLLNLTDSQREFAIERFTALDVYARFCLDLQRTVLDKAADAVMAMRRLKSIREFICESVSAAFRRLRQNNTAPTTRNITRLTRSALRETLDVFEEYLT